MCDPSAQKSVVNQKIQFQDIEQKLMKEFFPTETLLQILILIYLFDIKNINI